MSPAIFALGPMCTTSTPPRYIQCTGKPKSGCGPLCMPSTRAYQSRAAGPERWTAMEGGVPILVGGECIGGVGVAGGNWEFDEKIARDAVEAIGASWDAARK